MMHVPLHTIVVAALIRNTDNQVLLIRHYRRGWEMPVGKVEVGEDLITAAKREVAEESGIAAAIQQLVALHSKVDDPPALAVIFHGRAIGGELRPSKESPEVNWFAPEEALALVVHPVSKERLHDALAYSGRPIFRRYTMSPFHSVEVG